MATRNKEYFYITTPIYYPNAEPHIGHAYTTIYADTLARYHRLVGDDTFFLTGTDEHGQKLQRAAEKRGIHPKHLVDEMSEKYKYYWSLIDIRYDRFIRTTDPDHEELVKNAIKTIYEKGLIYKDTYAGYYCVDCERFYTSDEYLVIDGKPHCPIHRKPLEWLEETTYYFRLSSFGDFLKRILGEEGIVYPKSYAVEVLRKIEKEGLKDVSIARPKERVWWGIPVPFDPDYTIYVWFDALLNYLTGIQYGRNNETFQKYWPVAHHVIGKDILWFHTAIWFSMLEALEIPLPKKVIVHAFLVNRGLKMGKSAGNIVPIDYLVERYRGSDGVRYVLMRLFNPSKDVDYTQDLFDSIYNSELADNYGNLVRRVGVLVKKKLDGEVVSDRIDEEMESAIHETIDEYEKNLEAYEVAPALESVMGLLRKANSYINREAPWEKDNPSRILYTLIEVVRSATILLHPVIPKATNRLSEAFGFQIRNIGDALPVGGQRYTVKDAPILFKKIK